MPKNFMIHMALFVSAHVLFYFVLQSERSSPPWLLWLKDAARRGEMGVYHEPTGIYVNGLWTLILIIDACYGMSGKNGRLSARSSQHRQAKAERSPNADVFVLPSGRSFPDAISPKSAATAPGRSLNPWIWLLLGGSLEIAWAFLLKQNWLGGPLLLIVYFSFYCLTKAAKQLPLSIVAAVFAGIGAAGTITLDMLIFERESHPVRLGLIALLICFICLLKIENGRRERD